MDEGEYEDEEWEWEEDEDAPAVNGINNHKNNVIADTDSDDDDVPRDAKGVPDIKIQGNIVKIDRKNVDWSDDEYDESPSPSPSIPEAPPLPPGSIPAPPPMPNGTSAPAPPPPPAGTRS